MRHRLWIAAAVGVLLLLPACAPDDGGMRDARGSPDPEVDLPDQVVDGLEDTRVARLDESAGISSFRGADDDESAMVTYLSEVGRKLDRTWSGFFERSGLKEPFVTWIYLRTSDGPYESRCLTSGGDPLVADSHTPNAFFCASDPDPARLPAAAPHFADPYGAIILPIATMIDLRNGLIFDRGLSRMPGDFAVAVILAHEFGHHVVSEMANQYSAAHGPQGKGSELIADCMAGIWAYAAHYESYLQPGDIEEAIATLELIGDPGPLDSSHGTAAERIAAFEIGYTTGTPARCLVFWS